MKEAHQVDRTRGPPDLAIGIVIGLTLRIKGVAGTTGGGTVIAKWSVRAQIEIAGAGTHNRLD